MWSQLSTGENKRAIFSSSSSSLVNLSASRLMLLLFAVAQTLTVANSTWCFECSSLNETYCPELMTSDDETIISYNDCKYIHEGKYCVKAIGIIGVTTGELYCFVCDETESQDYGCSSALFSAPLTSCRGTFDAHYCIKVVGLYAGSLGTRRFCSSRDLGNYCEYIRRPGDQREYRSCVYTCTGDGCNGTMGGPNLPNLWSLLAASVLSLIFIHFRDFSAAGFSSNDHSFSKTRLTTKVLSMGRAAGR